MPSIINLICSNLLLLIEEKIRLINKIQPKMINAGKKRIYINPLICATWKNIWLIFIPGPAKSISMFGVDKAQIKYQKRILSVGLPRMILYEGPLAIP